MRDHDARWQGIPEELRAALTRRGATLERIEHEAARTYLWLVSPTAPLFARHSADPADRAVLDHEARVREIVGQRGVLRAPAVLERGATWMLEEQIDPLPITGDHAIGLVVEAAGAIAGLPVPACAEPTPESRRARATRRLRTLTAPWLVRDLRRAAALRRALDLPTVTVHGDFHPGNLLLRGDAVYVVDWELAGPGPAGSDLLQLWASLPRAEDRDRLLDAAVDLVGSRHRGDLDRLRYVLLVGTIAAKIATALPASRDRRGARALRALLPEARRAARDGT